MPRNQTKRVSKDQWLDLGHKAFIRLEEAIDQLPPDDPKILVAIKEVFDRAYGKATEKHEVTGKDGNAIVVRWEK